MREMFGALAKLVSSAASGWRSTTVTSWPRSSNCQAVLMPMMPAPRTMVFIARSVRPTPAGQLLLKHTKQLRLLRAGLERDLQELAPSAPGGTREDERIAIAIN